MFAGTIPVMSLSSVVPNRPSSPCNFKPVKVLAMVQNLIRTKCVSPIAWVSDDFKENKN